MGKSLTEEEFRVYIRSLTDEELVDLYYRYVGNEWRYCFDICKLIKLEQMERKKKKEKKERQRRIVEKKQEIKTKLKNLLRPIHYIVNKSLESKKNRIISIIVVLTLTLVILGIWYHQYKKAINDCKEICVYSSAGYWAYMPKYYAERNFAYQEQCIDYCLTHKK